MIGRSNHLYKGNSLSEDYTHKLQEEMQSLLRSILMTRESTTHLQEEIQREKLKETSLQGTGIYTGKRQRESKTIYNKRWNDGS
jgi:hypothetical protein